MDAKLFSELLECLESQQGTILMLLEVNRLKLPVDDETRKKIMDSSVIINRKIAEVRAKIET